MQLTLIPTAAPSQAKATPKSVAPTQIPLSFEPIARPELKEPRYRVRCNYNGKHFGGEFFKAEIEIIARAFRVHSGPVSPQEFGQVAAAAIRAGGAL